MVILIKWPKFIQEQKVKRFWDTLKVNLVSKYRWMRLIEIWTESSNKKERLKRLQETYKCKNMVSVFEVITMEIKYLDEVVYVLPR